MEVNVSQQVQSFIGIRLVSLLIFAHCLKFIQNRDSMCSLKMLSRCDDTEYLQSVIIRKIRPKGRYLGFL